MSKHTPGPWLVAYGPDRHNDSVRIVKFEGAQPIALVRSRPNAHLIAIAPNLLKFVEDAECLCAPEIRIDPEEKLCRRCELLVQAGVLNEAEARK